MPSEKQPAIIKTDAKPRSRIESLFLLSTYITLGFACVCLTYAEIAIMRQIVYFAAFAGVALIASYLLEGKWSLSIWAANVVGGLIAAFAGVWIAFQVQRPDGGLMISLPFPTILLPYLGPVMMILLVAKLLRPKQTADHWGLQFIGLVCVALSCALADDVTFGALLLLYVASGLWSLALFFLYRQSAQRRSTQNVLALPRATRLAIWAIAILIGSLVLFFYTPRSGTQWQLAGANRQRTTVGLSEDPSIDLNGTGAIELSSEVVFDVQARNRDGTAKLDLPRDVFWRGPVFRYYRDGRWQNNSNAATPGMVSGPSVIAPGVANTTLPELGADEFYLDYTLKTRVGITPYLAQPIMVTPSGDLPVVRVGGTTAWRRNLDSTFSPADHPAVGRVGYRQVLLPNVDDHWSSPVNLQRLNLLALQDYPAALQGLEGWTRSLVQRLIERGRLSSDCQTRMGMDGKTHPIYYEEIARALENYLANSGDYHYSLMRERADTRIDPILDFLFNTRAGHCNRFASALALMLRVLGIPSQIVLGYRGFDPHGDGRYDVKQCHAHAWVEVLVPKVQINQQHRLRHDPETYHWLTLDPTPSAEAQAASAEAAGRWWTASQWDRNNLFKSLILNFTPANRDQAGSQLWEALQTIWTRFHDQLLADSAEGLRMRTGLLLGLASLLLTVVLAVRIAQYRFWRRGPAWRSEIMFHRRMLEILARKGWSPTSDQTPREFTKAVAASLNTHADGPALGRTVAHLAQLYYRVRFGKAPLCQDEQRKVTSELDYLAAKLA